MKRLLLLLLPAVAACAPERYSGLLPESPLVERDPHPELQWEAVESALGPTVHAENVCYDLRIYRNDTLVYSRDGLAAPRHRVESGLRPGGWFGWTVRARFSVASRERETQWTRRAGGRARLPPGSAAASRSLIPLEVW